MERRHIARLVVEPLAGIGGRFGFDSRFSGFPLDGYRVVETRWDGGFAFRILDAHVAGMEGRLGYLLRYGCFADFVGQMVRIQDGCSDLPEEEHMDHPFRKPRLLRQRDLSKWT